MTRPSSKKISDGPLRLNKFLASSGVASRRKADDLIAAGEVQVNGKTVFELGVQVDPEVDRITVHHKPVKFISDKVYLAFHKPENVLTSLSDPEGRPTVADYLPKKVKLRLFPVGRLDWDSEGLLFLTNDGQFSQTIAHPQKGVPKTYLVKLDGQPSDEHLKKLLRGVSLPGGKAKALAVAKVRYGDSKKYDWIKIIIDEGRNRQVRKMFEKIGFDVKKLRRVAIGNYRLGKLKKGQFLLMGPSDLKKALEWPRELKED